MVAENEQKMRDESETHEDDIEALQSEINMLQEELRQTETTFSGELNLKNSQLEALDKYLAETKESLGNMSVSHQQQMEQQQENFN
jgi:uncharacterized protein YukE